MANTSSVVHFGCKLSKRKYSFKLCREEYAMENTKSSFPCRMSGLEKKGAYAHPTGTEYSEDWCHEYRAYCLMNFDLQMQYFASLSQAEFEQALSRLRAEFPELVEVKDLTLYRESSGLYVMILDDYRQMYIGRADDICKRIRQHWTATIPFDRALFPLYDAEHSVLGIDAFRALDTTRILAWRRPPIYLLNELEADMVAAVPQKFLCNRIGGGITDGISAIATMNTRR